MKKEKRNKHYRHALVAIEKGDGDFICNIFIKQIGVGAYLSDEDIEEMFPEFAAKKPKRITAPQSEGGWWLQSNRKIRIKVLKACIKETNPKK